MNGRAYYNEWEPFAAEWLRNLIKAGLIADGEVDTRSIVDVCGDDLRGFTQCHFFAGVGGWSYALRLAGWPDDRPVWTGSCPCQPWSEAGQRKGADDARHLWPEWFRLIRERRPSRVFGEQIDSVAARLWIDFVYSDLEAIDYAVGAVVLPAASVGAPQRRHRTWILADADNARWKGRERQRQPDKAWQERQAARCEPMRPIGRSWPPRPGEVQYIPRSPDGVSNLMGRCRAYGNAIVPQVAAQFIKAVMEEIDA